MSLFKTKEWWRTEFETNERFYNQKLLIAPLLSFQKEDVIIIGNNKGVLKIYNILPRWTEMKFPISYSSNDLIIETQLSDCITDLKAGKFVSGSQKCHLAVLMPTKLCIFDIISIKESFGLGDKYSLEIKYERQLFSISMSLTTGPFGRVTDKDLLCIQFADGTLLFLDQDLNTFTQTLQCRLQHEPLLYLETNDIFITQNSDWVLSFYKYQNIVEFGKNLSQNSKNIKSIEPDYQYNLGETLLAVNSVKLNTIATGIIIVSEKGFYIFHDINLSLKQAKRISFNVLCIHTYIVEPDGKLLSMFVTDSKSIKVYENLSLKWSAEVAFTPTAVAIIRSETINGLIVMLSEDGNLELGYLGSHPSLNIAPSINRKRYNYVDAEKQLLNLRTEIKNSLTHGSNQSTSASLKSSLQFNTEIEKNNDFLNKTISKQTLNNEEDETVFSIIMNLCSNTVINNVQLYAEVLKPWTLKQDNLTLMSLHGQFTFIVPFALERNALVLSPDVNILITYEIDKSDIHVMKTFCLVDLKMICEISHQQGPAKFSTVIQLGSSGRELCTELLKDCIWGYSYDEIAKPVSLQLLHQENSVTLKCNLLSNQIHINSDDELLMLFFTSYLINKTSEKVIRNLRICIEPSRIYFLMEYLQIFCLARHRTQKIKNEIILYMQQLRSIIKKTMQVKDQNYHSSTDAKLLICYKMICQSIIYKIDLFAKYKQECNIAADRFYSILRIILSLLRVNTPTDMWLKLDSAVSFQLQAEYSATWEDTTKYSFGTIFHESLQKIGKGSHFVSAEKLYSIQDIINIGDNFLHIIDSIHEKKI